MKYTDGLFEFPVRTYDGFSVRKALKKEEDVDIPVDADWVEGKARIPVSEIIGFVDYIPRGSSVESVEQDGFDCCAVITRTMGDFICNIPSREFEILLNEFVEIYTDEIEALVQERLAEKQPRVVNKKSWWKRIFA